jgi:uncharacterized protein (DUF1800 family)
MSLEAAFHAAARFGLGPRPGELERIGGDPRGWLKEQLRNPTVPDPARIPAEERAKTRLFGRFAKQAGISRKDLARVYVEQSARRFQAHVRTDQPFYERQVMFWSNHFTVSIQRPIVAGLVNAFELEAIRPHVAGTFTDMLLAVAQHPAMLLYLDNAESVGPDSRLGRRRGKSINENLGREMMELHTLGVDGGYTQADVVALARILTGWSLARKDGRIVAEFAFHEFMHEPGPKVLLGRTFDQGGMEEGVAAMKMLAAHPSTARFVATKLARHYVADDPPAKIVEQLSGTFIESGGHLPSVMSALVDCDEAWAQPLQKLKNSYEYCVSTFRGLGREPDARQSLGSLRALDYRVFAAPSPAGYPDVASAWASPDAVMKRIDWSYALAERFERYVDPRSQAREIIGPVMSAGTRQAVARAPSGAEGLALFLVSPEFQRR